MQTRFAYNPNEAAKLIGVGLTKLYAEMREGRLGYKKVGRRTVIPRHEIERWLENLPTAAAKDAADPLRVSA